MAAHKRQPGMTLTELLVVIAIMAILLGITVPTARHLMDSFKASTGVRYLINAALSNARAIAVRNQAYAGVRFQQGADGYTYMIFIVHDMEGTGYANGFRAVMGRKPMKLPEDVGILANTFSAASTNAENDTLIDGAGELSDACNFSVIFSNAGKLTIHPVQMNGSEESSVQSVIIFSQKELRAVPENSRWSDYFSKRKIDYISPYTGELVMEYREKTL